MPTNPLEKPKTEDEKRQEEVFKQGASGQVPEKTSTREMLDEYGAPVQTQDINYIDSEPVPPPAPLPEPEKLVVDRQGRALPESVVPEADRRKERLAEPDADAGVKGRGVQTADEEVPPYDQWKTTELHEELDARGIDFKKSAGKPELVKLLENDDKAALR